jgi:DNA-directed RNA polymerase omega subunit
MTVKRENRGGGAMPEEGEEQAGAVDSKFRMVLVAASRAEQLIRGARPKMEAGKRKPTRLAMDEMGSGLIDWGYGPAPVRAEAAAPEAGEADATEQPAPAEVH